MLHRPWDSHQNQHQPRIRAPSACGYPRPLASGVGRRTSSPLCAHTLISLLLLRVSQLRSLRRRHLPRRCLLRASILSRVCCNLTGSHSLILCVTSLLTRCIYMALDFRGSKQLMRCGDSAESQKRVGNQGCMVQPECQHRKSQCSPAKWKSDSKDLSTTKRQKGERAASGCQCIGGLSLHHTLPYPDRPSAN